MGSVRLDSIANLLASHRPAHNQFLRRQDPDASPFAVMLSKDFLFVQTVQSGSIEPKDGDGDTYTLTVDHGSGQTLCSSDRRERSVGVAPTPQFLEGLGLSLDNPPNAALVIDNGNCTAALAVVELSNPTYDQDTQDLSYDLVGLGDASNMVDLDSQGIQAFLAEQSPTFGSSHLFINSSRTDASIACLGFAVAVQGIDGVCGMC